MFSPQEIAASLRPFQFFCLFLKIAFKGSMISAAVWPVIAQCNLF